MEDIKLQLFVKLLSGNTATLRFTTPFVSAGDVKQKISKITRIPIDDQRLIYSGRHLINSDLLSISESTVHLLSRLLGGKGGFGSLLRGAATKAGQKKTNNFDACRDMSGRRLRHVNAEKRLEEWRAEEEERRLEKIAEEFIKKTAKKGKQGVGNGVAQKYVERYRQDSAKCVAEVEESVRDSIMVGEKRKGVAAATMVNNSKRLKIWMGKRKMAESDTDDDGSDEENEKSVILDNDSNSDSSKEAERSSGSITGGKEVEESCSGGLCKNGSLGEKQLLVPQSLESNDSPGGEAGSNKYPMFELVIPEEIESKAVTCSEAILISGTEAIRVENHDCHEPKSRNTEEVTNQSQAVQNSEFGLSVDVRPINAEDIGKSSTKSETQEVEIRGSSKDATIDKKPLSFDEFDSSADLEVLGMERLKSELEAHGLKCGGTLQERAARLFLLKSTPVEMLPKKLLARK